MANRFADGCEALGGLDQGSICHGCAEGGEALRRLAEVTVRHVAQHVSKVAPGPLQAVQPPERSAGRRRHWHLRHLTCQLLLLPTLLPSVAGRAQRAPHPLSEGGGLG
eukprot:scaffold103923_cov61-Phaeocystis_antarctica.AAC.1